MKLLTSHFLRHVQDELAVLLVGLSPTDGGVCSESLDPGETGADKFPRPIEGRR